MAKDGTRRGGARIGSGPKTTKKAPPLINFDEEFDAEKDDFEVKNGKKSAEKCAKSADLGSKSSEKEVKTGKKSPKTALKTTSKSKTTSKTKEKSTSSGTKTTSRSKTAAKAKSSLTSEGKSTGKVQEKSVSSAAIGKSVKKSADTADNDIPELVGVDVPSVDEFLRAQQQCGKSLQADYIIEQTMKWLRKIKCANSIPKELVEEYAMARARWIQAEEMISEFGFLAKHPTTGQAMASPYVHAALDYSKQVDQKWYKIYQIIKEICSEGIVENSNNPMERLLKQRGG